MPERLQKIIARAGITSRRKAEELIVAGRVTVNGEVVRELGSQADASQATICVDGKALQPSGQKLYLALNKPKGCITSTSDPEGRPTVMDLLGSAASKGLFPVGRLDYNTEGLLLLTNDGEFANRILTAKNGIPKVYEVKLSRRPTAAGLERFREGFVLDGKKVRPEIVRLLRDSDSPWYQVTLIGGRNRQIHRMFERIGILVEKIRRVRIGKLSLRGLEPRQVRELRPEEIRSLMDPAPIQEIEDPPAEPSIQRPFRSQSKLTGRRGRGRPQAQPFHKSPRRTNRRTHRNESTADESRPRDSAATPKRKTSGSAPGKPASRLNRSARPPRPPGRGRDTSSRSPSRARPTGQGAPPRRSPSREQQDSPQRASRGGQSQRQPRDRRQTPSRKQGQPRRDEPIAEKPRRRDTRAKPNRMTRAATTGEPSPRRKRSVGPADRLPRGYSTGSRNPEAESNRSPSFSGMNDGTYSPGSRKSTKPLKRSARPRRPPDRRQPTSSRSPSRARPTGQGASPKRSPSPSRGRQNSRPRSKAKP